MSKYKVGDELKIREWDDMEAESGTTYENIYFGGVWFTKHMKRLCGLDFTVSSISCREDEGTYEYHSEEGTEGRYHIIAEMLEPRIEEPLYVATDDELKELMA